MNVKKLKEILETVSDDYVLDFSELYILKGEEDIYEYHLDYPISKLELDGDTKRIRFVLEADRMAKTVGTLTKIH